MSLKLITGAKRSGKTSRMLEEIGKNPEKSRVIVPEQNLFYYEKKILEKLGERKSFLTTVTSFLKLSLEILEDTDRFSSLKLMDNETANMLLASVIFRNKKNLKLFKNDDKSDYRERIKSQISEFKKHLISPFGLEAVINDRSVPESLRNKLSDISLIMSEYEKRCADVFSDSDSLITEAAEIIASGRMFENINIHIDGFTGFTGEELELIRAIDISGGNIYIYLDYDEGYGKRTGDLYSSVGIAAGKFRKMFPGLSEEKVTGSIEGNGEIRHICENMFTRENEYEKEPEKIKLYKSATPRREAEFVSAYIAEKIRDGASAGDFQVVCNGETEIRRVAKELEAFGISSYAEVKNSVSSTPVYTLISNVFDLLLLKPSCELCVSYLKSLCFIKDENVFRFENFIASSGVKGWHIISDKGFDGVKENAYNFNPAEEADLKEVYNKTFLPLIKLKKKLAKAEEAFEYCALLYDFFEEISLRDVICDLAEEFEKDGNRISAVQYVQVYNALTEILERCSLILKNEKLSLRDFKNVLFENLSAKNISSLPLDSDSVYISSSTSVSPGLFKYICLINADDSLTEGGRNEGFINENDRKILEGFNIELSLSPAAKKTEEKLKLFTLLTSAEEELVISYPVFKSNGDETPPSEIVDGLKRIFPALKEKKSEINIYTEKNLIMEGLSMVRGEKEEEGAGILRQLLESSEYGDKTHSILGYLGRTPVTDIKIANVGSYLKDELKLSVTALEKFRACGFSYYIKYILKGREKDIFKVDNAGIGSLLHMVMQRFSEQVKKEGRNFSEIDDEYIDSRLDKIVEKSVKEVNSGLFETGGRASYMAKKVKRDSRRTLKLLCEHFKSGEFTEHAFELSFGREGDPLSGMEISLSEGRKIILSGTIDRVDTFEKDGKDYIRIIDYKSTMKTVDLYEIYYGLNIQLITYLMVALNSEIDKKLLPGGVMYLTLENPMISIKNPKEAGTVEAQIRNKLMMKGIFLNDPEILAAMDRELITSGSSEIIEIELDPDNVVSKGKALSLSEFDAVFEKLTSNIRNMAEQIYKGDYKIRPVRNGGKSGCDYCPYSPICCFEESVYAFEEIEKEDFNRILEKIKEGE